MSILFSSVVLAVDSRYWRLETGSLGHFPHDYNHAEGEGVTNLTRPACSTDVCFNVLLSQPLQLCDGVIVRARGRVLNTGHGLSVGTEQQEKT